MTQWHFDNHQRSLTNKKKWHVDNRDKMLVNMKANHQKRMEENPQKEYEDRKKWREDNRDKVYEYSKKWRQDNKDRLREYHKVKYSNDPNYKLVCLLRAGTRRIIINGCKKNCKTLTMLDCSVEFIRQWLESRFDSEMTWDNHGKYWHIDHFMPVVCFDLSKPDNQNICFHWTNLQPLEGKANLSKGCKVPTVKRTKETTKKNSQIL